MNKGKIFSNYSLINGSTIEGRKQIIGALTAFMRQPQEVGRKLLEADIRQFTTSSDFASETLALIDKIHLGIEDVDVGYEYFFDVKDFSGVSVPGFRVRDVQSGLTFSKRPVGGKAKIYKVTGTEVFVTFDVYGGGLEFDEAWWQDQEWWLIEDNAAEFRSAWYRDKGTIMYDLIGNVSSSYNTAYDATGATALEKDIITINTGALAMLNALIAAGYNVTPATPIYCLSPLTLKPRLERALAAVHLIPGVVDAAAKVEYAIKPVYSLNVRNANAACTDKWYLGVPGLKNKIGEKMQLTIFGEFKIESFATTVVGWGRYGATANGVQFRRLATA